MGHITADAAMADHLGGLLEPVEVRDEQGQLLGVYTPHVAPEVLAKYEKVIQSLDLDKIRRIAEEQKGQGAPLEEVLRRIEARGNAG
jgi:hypothetical protein